MHASAYSAWAAEENWHSRRSEEKEGNARLAATLNIIMNIPFKYSIKVDFELRWESTGILQKKQSGALSGRSALLANIVTRFRLLQDLCDNETNDI